MPLNDEREILSRSNSEQPTLQIERSTFSESQNSSPQSSPEFGHFHLNSHHNDTLDLQHPISATTDNQIPIDSTSEHEIVNNLNSESQSSESATLEHLNTVTENENVSQNNSAYSNLENRTYNSNPGLSESLNDYRSELNNTHQENCLEGPGVNLQANLNRRLEPERNLRSVPANSCESEIFASSYTSASTGSFLPTMDIDSEAEGR